jgi:copper chaperone CopZ
MSEKHIHLHIEGMSCGHCQKTVTDAILQVSGVKKVVVTLVPPTAEIYFDDAHTSPEAILGAVDATEVYSGTLI